MNYLANCVISWDDDKSFFESFGSSFFDKNQNYLVSKDFIDAFDCYSCETGSLLKISDFEIIKSWSGFSQENRSCQESYEYCLIRSRNNTANKFLWSRFVIEDDWFVFSPEIDLEKIEPFFIHAFCDRLFGFPDFYLLSCYDKIFTSCFDYMFTNRFFFQYTDDNCYLFVSNNISYVEDFFIFLKKNGFFEKKDAIEWVRISDSWNLCSNRRKIVISENIKDFFNYGMKGRDAKYFLKYYESLVL